MNNSLEKNIMVNVLFRKMENVASMIVKIVNGLNTSALKVIKMNFSDGCVEIILKLNLKLNLGLIVLLPNIKKMMNLSKYRATSVKSMSVLPIL